MRISATPDISGNERAVEALRAGLESAVAVAVGQPMPLGRPRNEDRQRFLDPDVVTRATADTAPEVARLLERAIAEGLARTRLYGAARQGEPDASPWLADRQRRAG
jgi:hypothetical protein